jgi:hypothetical protein
MIFGCRRRYSFLTDDGKEAAAATAGAAIERT